MNKYIKSAFALIFSLMLLFAMAGCSSGESAESEEITSSLATTAPTEATLPGPTTEEGGVYTPGAVGESAAVTASYFDDAAFVGDSVSLKLSYYAAATGELGNAQFFTAGSLGSGNALWEVSDESVHPSYQGTKMLVEDCIAYSGVSKVYIMLGMNDIGLYGIEDALKNYEELVTRIKAQSPDVQIIIQSMTPMAATSTIIGEDLNNENIKIYNKGLSDLCKKNGWAFVDVACVMYDADNETLNPEFCSDAEDMGVHFTEAGCAQWIEYLSTHTP